MSVNKPRIITVSGLTASGKSTTAKLLADHLGYAFLEEAWLDNPYLEEFYKTGKGYIQVQDWFIAQDIRRHRIAQAIFEQGRGVVIDKPAWQNLTYIQATANSQDDVEAVMHIFKERASGILVHTNLNVFTSIEETLLRIKARGREHEQVLTDEWFIKLHTFQAQVLGGWEGLDKFEFDAGLINLIDEPERISEVASLIKVETSETEDFSDGNLS